MSKKERKSLGNDEELARQFVYQEDSPPVSTPLQLNKPESSNKQAQKTDLVSKLETPAREATVRLTVDLPESMHRKLSILAARTGKKKAEIVRLLLDDTLQDIED